jgi:putative PIN family toxin of toxin-antitoxin system
MKLRVVIDTNLLISAVLFDGTPGTLLEAARDQRFVLLWSAVIMAEFQRKLATKFKKPLDEIQERTKPLAELCVLVVPQLRISGVVRDSDDDRILECAIAGQADFLITGDKDLLVLGAYRDVKILTARQFLDWLTISNAHPKPLP